MSAVTIDTRGTRDSSEHLFYTWEEGTSETSSTIYKYRHALVDKFVEHLEYAGATVLKTRIHHTVRGRGEFMAPVTFEFEVSRISDGSDTTRYATKGWFDQIVDKLLKALEAEAKLEEAQREVTRNSF